MGSWSLRCCLCHSSFVWSWLAQSGRPAAEPMFVSVLQDTIQCLGHTTCMNITRHTGHTIRGSHPWKLNRVSASDRHQGWGQIRFIKYKYKYIFFRVSNTNTNTPEKIWSNTNTNTAHQIQIHTEADTKLPPFYRWHIQINFIVRKLFYLFKFHWKLFPKVQSTMSLHWFRKWLGSALSRQQAIIWPMMAQFTDA